MVAFAARVVGTDALRTDDGGVRTPSPDAHYLLKRTVDTWRSFPTLPTWEPRLSCPEGTAPPWPQGLNLGGAALARLVLDADAQPAAVERLIAWLPPVAGALACALVALLGGLWFGAWAGFAAGILAALLPIRVWNSAFAIVDHHVLGGFIPLLVVACILHADQRQQGTQRSPRWHLDGYILAALVAGAGYWTWTEMWLQQGLLMAVGLLWAVLDMSAPAARAGRLAGLTRWSVATTLFALPGIVTAPYFVHARVAPHAPSRFTLWVLAALAAAPLAAWAADRWQRRPTLTLLAAGCAGLLVFALAAALDGPMADALAAAAGFAGAGGIIGVIDESRSLLSRPMPQPLTLLSGAILLAPALPLAWRGLAPSNRLLLTLWYALSLPLALLQTRFALPFSTPFCLALGCLLTQGVPPHEGDEGPRLGWLRWLAAVLVLTVLPSMALRSYWNVEHESRDRLVHWMADSLATDDAQKSPSGCLMAPWDVGHEALRNGNLAVVAHPFTEHLDRQQIRRTAAFLFGEDLRHHWQQRFGDLTWVWITAMDADDVAAHLGELGRPPLAPGQLLTTNWARLLFADGSAVALAGGGAETRTLPGFGHLRRVRTSPLMIEGAAAGGPAGPVHNDKIFVVVPGAHIVGTCKSGREIEASLMVQHPGAKAFRFAQVGRCSVDGRFDLRVPYANSGMGHQLRASPAWTVATDGDERWQARVSEEDVRLSREVTVSDLYADRP